MIRDLVAFFGSDRYAPVSQCLTNDTVLWALYTIMYTMSSISLVIMGSSVIYHYRLGLSLSSQSRLLFGTVLFLCALQEAASLITIYVAVYRLDIIIKAIVAAVSFVCSMTTTREIIRYGRVVKWE